MDDKILARETRAYESNGKRQGSGVQLSESDYNGRTSYTLRSIWLTPDEQWRWGTCKPDRNGKTWAAIKMSDPEAFAVFLALEKVFKGRKRPDESKPHPSAPRTSEHSSPVDDDDIPF